MTHTPQLQWNQEKTCSEPVSSQRLALLYKTSEMRKSHGWRPSTKSYKFYMRQMLKNPSENQHLKSIQFMLTSSPHSKNELSSMIFKPEERADKRNLETVMPISQIGMRMGMPESQTWEKPSISCMISERTYSINDDIEAYQHLQAGKMNQMLEDERENPTRR